MNNRKKGQRIELLGLKKLKELDWFLEARAPPPTRWARQIDLCGGFFDAILHKWAGGLKQRLYVQFKSGNTRGLKQYQDYCQEKCDDRDFVELWVYVQRKGFKVYRWHKELHGTELVGVLKIK